MECLLHRVPMLDPGDASAILQLIDEGLISPHEIVAVFGKAEGNGCVNDFTRGYATAALSPPMRYLRALRWWRHPYTRALLSAVPRLTPAPKRAALLVQGEPPSGARLPLGCVFSNRCPSVEPACTVAEPALENALDHQVACRRWRELLSSARAA
jgi:oligopeptide/dipeptide ABC transporter ATP-binding protein